MSFRAGWIYPLLEPDQFDDDLGTGYDHVAVPHTDDPGDCYIVDAWPCDSDGKTHPGYDACPVPISADAVSLDLGRPLDCELPERRSFGWR